jgi:hypothetical protein
MAYQTQRLGAIITAPWCHRRNALGDHGFGALGLFGVHYHKHLVSSASDDRALFDTLLPARFPGAHPELTVAIARFINF